MNVKQKRNRKDDGYVTNEKIRCPEVRVVQSGEFDGVHSTKYALNKAKNAGLDLIEINSSAKPPVCRITELSKFKYEQRKREKDNKDKTKTKPLKEIKFGPNTGDHDFEFKLKHAKSFLEKGHKVKAYVQFRGREMAFKEQGELMLLKFAEKLTDEGKVDALPQMNGRKMFMTISPKVKK